MKLALKTQLFSDLIILTEVVKLLSNVLSDGFGLKILTKINKRIKAPAINAILFDFDPTAEEPDLTIEIS